MAEYIKREDAMKALDKHRLSHTMSMHGDMEMLIEYRDGVIGAMNALAFVPTADVVPKSEVVRMLDEIYKEADQTGTSGVFLYGIRVKVVELKKKYTEGDS